VRRGDCPESLAGDTSRGGEERDKAVAFFSDPANYDRKFTFTAYKSEDVFDALTAMFGPKCAYCEAYCAGTMKAAVDHYRPKGGVEEANGTVRKPGYYWLAADWENLLPSCTDCNSARYHRFPEGRRKTGKAAKFPLLDEASRARGPGEEVREEPYLLDPCRDEPHEHLEFLADGTVRAGKAADAISTRGEKTVEILGLGRPGLSLLRSGHFRRVETALTHFREAVEALDRDPDNEKAQARLSREIRDLRRLMSNEACFCAMARQLIEPVLKAAGISL
jgi:uncharacterized protein (TIGR02646 family)